MMDEVLKIVIANAPSVAGMLLMLFWQQRRIDQLLTETLDINRQLIALLERQFPQPPSKVLLP